MKQQQEHISEKEPIGKDNSSIELVVKALNKKFAIGDDSENKEGQESLLEGDKEIQVKSTLLKSETNVEIKSFDGQVNDKQEVILAVYQIVMSYQNLPT